MGSNAHLEESLAAPCPRCKGTGVRPARCASVGTTGFQCELDEGHADDHYAMPFSWSHE